MNLTNVAEGTTYAMANNFAAFLFDELWYELDGVEIDRNKNVGITSTIKNYISLTFEKAKMLRNVAWSIKRIEYEEYFNVCVNHSICCWDFAKIINAL